MDMIDNKDLGTHEGFEIRAEMAEDVDATPYEADCYTEADVKAWKSDKWRFVVVTVTASLDGHELGTDSLGAVEYGTLGNGTECSPLRDDHPIETYGMIANAIKDARNNILALIDKATEAGVIPAVPWSE